MARVLHFLAVVTALSCVPGEHVPVTCSLSHILRCVHNYQDVIRKHTYHGVQDKLRDGCQQFKAYVKCLGEKFECNATVGDHHTITISNVTYISDGDFLQELHDNTSTADAIDATQNATNTSQSPVKIDLSVSSYPSSDNSSSSEENHLIRRWQYGIMQTSIIYDTLGLCNNINVTTLKNQTHDISQNKTDLSNHTDMKCFKLFPCFTGELDGIQKHTNYCTLMDAFVACIKANKCPLENLNTYESQLDKNFKPLVEKLKQIPKFCETMTN